jgi:hypothetical protein
MTETKAPDYPAGYPAPEATSPVTVPTPPPLRPTLIFQAAQDVALTAHAKLAGPDGTFVNFEIDRELAYGIITELVYHLNRQERALAEEPKNTVPRGLYPLSENRSSGGPKDG